MYLAFRVEQEYVKNTNYLKIEIRQLAITVETFASQLPYFNAKASGKSNLFPSGDILS